MANRATLFRQPIEAVLLRSSEMMSSALVQGRTSVLVERSAVGRGGMWSGAVLAVWIKVQPAHLTTGERASSFLVLVGRRATIYRALIILENVERIWIVICIQTEGVVFMLVDHRGWSCMATILRRRWTPWAWKGGWRKNPAIELRRRRTCKRWRRTSVGREIERWWRASEPRWG